MIKEATTITPMVMDTAKSTATGTATGTATRRSRVSSAKERSRGA